LTTPQRHQQHVPRDAEQPRGGRAVDLVAEAAPNEPCLGEGLGRQVERRILVAGPAHEIPVDAFCVAVIELAKRGRVAAGCRQQGGVGRHDPDETVM
jgi:hypothetical protein